MSGAGGLARSATRAAATLAAATRVAPLPARMPARHRVLAGGLDEAEARARRAGHRTGWPPELSYVSP